MAIAKKKVAARRDSPPRTRIVSATEFKAKCLSLIDEIEEHGLNVTITRRGKPVATVGPAKKERWTSPKGSWMGRARFVGDDIYTDIFGVFTQGQGKTA